jgi:hypothetical protein
MALVTDNTNVSPLNLGGSAKFRDKLLSRNLAPYNLEGQFSFAGEPPGYPVKLSDDIPKDTPNISTDVFEEALTSMVVNKYGPANDIIDFANNIGNNAGLVSMQQQGLGSVQVPSNGQQGQYGQSQAFLDLISDFFIDSNAVVNRYFPQDGYTNSYTNSEVILQKKDTQFGEYPSFTPPDFGLVGGLSNGIFSLFEISNLESTLSQDSYLQQISIGFLQEAFRERIAREVYKNTIGKVNLQAFSDPFTASLLASGQQSLIAQNYTITVPDGVVDQTSYLLQRFSGTYIPVSPIEGDYFDAPERRKTKFGQFVQSAVNLFTKPATPSNRSVKFLNNTGSGQKNVLFNNIGFNIYKPNYDLNTTQVGLAIDTIFGKDNSIGKLYVGEIEDLQYVTSPRGKVPYDPITGIETTTPVLGPDALGKLFEGPDVDQYYKNWGLASKSMGEDGDPTGGFSWVTSQSSAMAGRFVGPDNTTQTNGEPFGTSPSFDGIAGKFVDSQSNRVQFRKRSILENTQRLVESGEKATGKERLRHVGNAINQVSKVFHDGYKELTKGSKVRKYIRKNGTEVGMEYGRVFTKDSPYMVYGNLQSTVANDSGAEANGNLRKFSYSVVDSTYNLNIAPLRGDESTNIIKGVGVKKYMFSIENLAWRGTPEYNELPICEKGPNGGRIMWFPPYDLELGQENSSPTFNPTKFLGRPEPIYTYESTERSGSISWSIIVDHPSISNLIVRKELENVDNNTTTQVLASFFSGLKKYDIYDLARRYNTLSQKTLTEAYEQVIQNTKSSSEDITQSAKDQGQPTNLSPIENELQNVFDTYINSGFYFDEFNANESGENYENIYSTYVSNINNFISNNPAPVVDAPTAEVFLQGILRYNFENLEALRIEISNVIQEKSGIVEITFSGTKILGDPSSTEESTYWVESAKKFFNDFQIENNTIGDFVGKYITYKTENLGTLSTNSPKSGTSGDEVNCEGPSIGRFSFNDCACRSVLISKVTFTPVEPKKSSGENQQTIDQTGTKPQQQNDIPTKLKGISKKIIRELLTECNYFDVLKSTDSFLFDKIKDKFKFFNPAFHSITPEGLNARLVFLHQCVRPGRTIPTKKSETENNFYNDAFNTNFGSPPVLVLRFGDFYNTKIIPDNFSITYENLFDFNPEGIGFQPMIAKINLGFKMIGGHGLKEPVEKLQNALTFNYFANTEMYDERAEATEPTDAIDNALIQAIWNEEPLAPINNVNDVSDNGKTFGDIIQANQSSGGTQTGQIQYDALFNGFIDVVQNYFTDTLSNYVSFVEEYNQGLWYQINYKSNYSTGFFNATDFNSTEKVITNIFGKIYDYQTPIDETAALLFDAIDNNQDYYSIKINENPFFTPSEKTKLINNYKIFITDTLLENFNRVEIYIQDSVQSQLNMTLYMAKMDYISFSGDGKTLPDNTSKLYSLTGTTSNSGEDSLVEFKDDYLKVMSGVTDFYTLGTGNTFIDRSIISGNIVAWSPINAFSNPTDNYVYILMSNIILDDFEKQKMVESLVLGLGDKITVAEEAVNTILNFWKTEFSKEKTDESKQAQDFLKSQQMAPFSNFQPERNGLLLSSKQRIMDFITDGGNPIQQQAFTDIISSSDYNNDKNIFNGKKQFL